MNDLMAIWLKRITPLVIIGMVLVAASRLIPKPEPIVQPIQYNHKLHVEQEGMECIDCHRYVEEKPYATIPQIEICSDCHFDEPLSESPEEEKLIAHVESDSAIPWERIYRVPDHVYFSHRRHVTLGEISCSNCHGNVAEQLAPAPQPMTPMSMEWCVDCHRENKVSNDCLTCHR